MCGQQTLSILHTQLISIFSDSFPPCNINNRIINTNQWIKYMKNSWYTSIYQSIPVNSCFVSQFPACVVIVIVASCRGTDFSTTFSSRFLHQFTLFRDAYLDVNHELPVKVRILCLHSDPFQKLVLKADCVHCRGVRLFQRRIFKADCIPCKRVRPLLKACPWDWLYSP